MSTAVSLRRLTKAYGGDAPVVDELDLDVVPGEMVALLGPSGCGKTTTLKVVAGLLEPTAGDVLFDGASVVDTPAEKRPVAMVFQKPLLFPHMTVAQNVGFGLKVRGVRGAEASRRVAEMLDLVRLPGYESRRVGELSGGQEQRVSLARALVVRPSVLLLDEPLSQLDAGLRVEMRELVRKVQQEVGVTSLFVTHDQEEAVVVADRVALMLDGRLQQLGVPQDFYERPASLEVARFVGTANAIAGDVAAGTFRSGGLRVPVPGADGPGVLLLRQEAVRVVGPAEAGVDAVVLRTAYTGTAVRVWVDAQGTEVALVVDPTQRLAAGDRLRVQLPAEHCTVVATSDPTRRPPST